MGSCVIRETIRQGRPRFVLSIIYISPRRAHTSVQLVGVRAPNAQRSSILNVRATYTCSHSSTPVSRSPTRVQLPPLSFWVSSSVPSTELQLGSHTAERLREAIPM